MTVIFQSTKIQSICLAIANLIAQFCPVLPSYFLPHPKIPPFFSGAFSGVFVEVATFT